MPPLELPPTTDSVPRARRYVRDELRESPADVDTAVLLVSEVVTNAVLHARSQVRVLVRHLTAGARVEVHDRSAVEPRPTTFSPMSTTGRGLRLLDSLAAGWGVRADAGGKTVWFEVGEPSDQAWEDFDVEGLVAEGLTRDV